MLQRANRKEESKLNCTIREMITMAVSEHDKASFAASCTADHLFVPCSWWPGEISNYIELWETSNDIHTFFTNVSL